MSVYDEISLAAAKSYAINAQLLSDRSAGSSGKSGVIEVLEALGYIQIDTIAVIERAHHQTLFSRRTDYNPALLHDLQATDRRVFEYWAHAASYIPLRDFRFYLPLMQRHREGKVWWAEQLLRKHGDLTEVILNRIREEGPLLSRDFKAAPGEKRGQWWDWKPAKSMLELLFWRGDLMIKERHNFQRVYDLTERVLPEWVDVTMPTREELGLFLVRKAVTALGIGTEKEIHGYIPITPRNLITTALRQLIETRELITVQIVDSPKDLCFMNRAALESVPNVAPIKQLVCILSPFDNLVIDRSRLKRLFGFEYTIECYLPAAKRRYGYFCLPILWGNQFVGRLDAAADRKTKVFTVKSLIFEDAFTCPADFITPFCLELQRLASFNHCSTLVLESVHPKLPSRKLQSLKRHVKMQ